MVSTFKILPVLQTKITELSKIKPIKISVTPIPNCRGAVKHNIFTEKMIDKITKDTLEYIKTSENTNKKELSRLTALANTTQSKIDKLLDAYLDDHINKIMLSEKTNKLKKELDSYNDQIYDLQIRSYDFLDEEKIKAFYLSFKTKIESNDEKLLRQIIE